MIFYQIKILILETELTYFRIGKAGLLLIEKLLCSCKRPGPLLMIVFAASLLSCGEHDHDEVRASASSSSSDPPGQQEE